MDCQAGVGGGDVMLLLDSIANIGLVSVRNTNCLNVGDPLSGGTWGNVDCLGGVDMDDVIAIILHLAGLDYPHGQGCPAIGDTVDLG
jgi:hypothetical protein